MTGLTWVIVALAGIVLVTSIVFFIAKYIRYRWARARDLRRAIYINTISELVSRLSLPDVELEGWRRDPIFAERLVDALDVFDGMQRDHLIKLADHISLTEDLVNDLGARRTGTRLDAATALARLASPDLIEPFTVALSDPVSEVRVRAAAGLARIGDPASVTKILRQSEQEEEWAAQLMIDALVSFGSAAVPAIAAEILIDAPAIEGRSKHLPGLVRALGAIGDPIAEPALLHALTSDDPVMRLRAAEALGEAGSPDSIGMLVRALGDDDWRVRSKAAVALGSQGDAGVVSPLRTALRDSEWWVRQAAAEAIARLPKGSEILRAALDDEDPFARDAALERLTLNGQVRIARAMGPGDELYDKLVSIGREHLVVTA